MKSFDEIPNIRYSLSVARIDIRKLAIPEKVCLELGDFLFRDYKTNESQEKLNFLYTAIYDKYEKRNPRKLVHLLKYLERILKEYGVQEILYEDSDSKFNGERNSWKAYMNPEKAYYIETDYMEDDMFSELMFFPRRLISFLFSEKSFLGIQEDNCSRNDRTDMGPEKSTEKVYYGWTWFC